MLGYEISMLCSGFCRKDMLELTEDIDKWNQRTYEVTKTKATGGTSFNLLR